MTMKFRRETKSKSTYDDVFHDTISELENISRANVFKF